MKIYHDKEAAQAEVDRRIEKTKPKHFCPLIKDTCRKDCINIVHPHRFSTYNWHVYDWYCNNPMIVGGE